MANNYMWKDKYYDVYGTLIPETDLVFCSILGDSAGIGTRNSPMRLVIPFTGYSLTKHVILSGGHHAWLNAIINGYSHYYIYGRGGNQTSLSLQVSALNKSTVISLVDIMLEDKSGSFTSTMTAVNVYRCILRCDPERVLSTTKSSLIETPLANSLGSAINNSFLGVEVNPFICFSSNLSLFEKCTIAITSATINNYKHNYLAFDNCKLKIGEEPDYSELIGDTKDERRQSFVDRCMTQGITDAQMTVSGETEKLGRWVFSKGSTIGGKVITGSELAEWQGKRYIKLGWSPDTIDALPITVKGNVPQSISPVFPNSKNLDIKEGAISIPFETDITNPLDAYFTSNVFWLGGKYGVKQVDLFNNLPARYGVLIDSAKSLSTNTTVSGNIEAGEYYIVRSSNKQPATVTYNGISYSTDLLTRNNIFVGVDNVKSYTSSANVAVYKILDLSMQKTIQMRIVDKLPAGNIVTGNLQAGYWYFVEPNDFSNTSGTITYKGVEYPCFSSFPVDSSSLTFVVKGNCHLRRCWRDDYKQSTEITDKSFWANIQKPQWFDVAPNDFRCFMKFNNPNSGEMLIDDKGGYITSGHPSFYPNTTGASGFLLPDYSIVGSYIQLRIALSTLNPM